MSMTCAVLANSPTIRPRRNAGLTTVRSCRWPVPSQGSLVMKWSPSRIVSTGNFARKCPTLSIMELTWPGVPVTACASIRPRRSKMPAERSPASRTVVEKAVRIIVCACSSTTAIRRFHMICRWMAASCVDAVAVVGAVADRAGSACTPLSASGASRRPRSSSAAKVSSDRISSMWPSAVTRPRQPAPRRVDVSASATIAGPSKLAPGPRLARS